MADFAVQTQAGILALPGLLIGARAVVAELMADFPGQLVITKVATLPSEPFCFTVNDKTGLQKVADLVRSRLAANPGDSVEVLVVIPADSWLARFAG